MIFMRARVSSSGMISLSVFPALMQFITSKWISKPISVAAELGIADLLADGPRHIDELAGLTGTHAPTLYRVMRALSCVGIFSEREDHLFELTPMAECLADSAMRSIALMFLSGSWLVAILWFIIPACTANVYLAPVLAQAQGLVSLRMRAVTSALALLIIEFVSQGGSTAGQAANTHPFVLKAR